MSSAATVPYLLPKEFLASSAALNQSWSRDQALAYTRWLAHAHYENFQVVSFLLPRELHQDFYNVYAFCRWADDLGDEIEDTAESLRLLAWWRGELEAMYGGRAAHPVFIALQGTAERHRLPPEPFQDLICAFIQDQTVTRYANWTDLFAYCRCSANPVGRLVLYLGGYRDAARQRLSDATCTALQLANFWQDVSVDLQKGRVYLPTELMARHGYTVEDLYAGRQTPQFQATMREAVGEARRLFHEGLPLVGMVDRRLSLDLDLFSRGGLAILDKIGAQDYRVLHQRPAISKGERVMILLRSLVRHLFRKAMPA